MGNGGRGILPGRGLGIGGEWGSLGGGEWEEWW